ncbi:MAG: hypothetical protein ABSB82_16790 [Terriglobia bacterium]|jgi:hypothetical protein
MPLILLLLVMIASTPTMATPSITSAQTTNQSSSGDAIRAATRLHNRLFASYLVILLITVIGTYLVWWSGNKVQDTIQIEANHRVAQVELGAQNEIKRVEADSKERIAKAQQESEEKIAALNAQAESLKAGAEQLKRQNLETESRLTDAQAELISRQSALEKEEQKTAAAQKEAAEAQRKLNEAIVTRILGRQLKDDFVVTLKKFPPGKAEVWCAEESESRWFAISILNALRESKWDVPRDPIAISLSRFDGKDLPLWGNQFFSKDVRTGFIPVPIGVTMSAMSRSDFMGLMQITDERIAVLATELDISSFVRDPALPSGLFKILIGPRNPTQ